MTSPLTRAERDKLLAQVRELEAKLYPDDEAAVPKGRARSRMKETYYRLLGEYGDRLPRVVMGTCPFTGAALKRSFDPFGLDGPWWFVDIDFDIDEPKSPPAFKVVLGAFSLHGRSPVENSLPVVPGPEVPFVVPRLLGLPGMKAVISRLELATGDFAYPISYWSEEEIGADELHQPWLRQQLWFKDDGGDESWLIANDSWDFELAPWIKAGKLLWIEPGDAKGKVLGMSPADACPYLGLPGGRQPQSLSGGELELLDPPDDSPIAPFEE